MLSGTLSSRYLLMIVVTNKKSNWKDLEDAIYRLVSISWSGK